MPQPAKKLGFGDTRQTAEHFGLSEDIVVDKAERGEWPSWFVGGRRVFDLDDIVSILLGTDRRQEENAVATRGRQQAIALDNDARHPTAEWVRTLCDEIDRLHKSLLNG